MFFVTFELVETYCSIFMTAVFAKVAELPLVLVPLLIFVNESSVRLSQKKKQLFIRLGLSLRSCGVTTCMTSGGAYPRDLAPVQHAVPKK